jgi:hypothetical protein
MSTFARRSARRFALVAVLFASAAGIAYAAIPDGNGVYTACMLKSIGTIRLIDPSLPASNPMGHCSSLETRITFNQQGQQGSPGSPGAPGKDGQSVTTAAEPAGSNCANGGASFTAANGTTYACNGAPGAPGHAGMDGKDGVSPTVAQLSPGDAHCGAGGAAIADANGNTAYVCNGTNGRDGEPFSGTFISPSGLFSVRVTDSGISLEGPSGSIKMGVGALELNGALIRLGSAGCLPAARLGDSVNGGSTVPMGGPVIDALITTGSNDVCIG